MFAEVLLAAAFQVGPFYEQRPDYRAIRPLCSFEGEATDVVWPLYTAHRDWWRFCYLVEGHRSNDESSFSLMPFWWNGHDRNEGDWWAFFPFWGHHPHFLLMDDFDFALWPLWHAYSTPRGETGESLRSNAVLFPFFSWRSDGSWGVWPVAGLAHRRESDHRYALWPIATWADYRADRDTAGEGASWMVWPFYGEVNRVRERQRLVLPPFFSYVKTPTVERWRLPWPLVEVERGMRRERTSVWPFYEHVVENRYLDGSADSEVTRFGWKLVELYDDETRAFPFYASGRGHFRLWPFYESESEGDMTKSRSLALFPIRWVPAVDRNWAKFWTLYECESDPVATYHSLFWGIIRWRSLKR